MMVKKGTCKHFNGIQNELCGAGMHIRDMTGGENHGWARRMPCFKTNNFVVACSNYCEPTDEEIAKEEAEIDNFIKVVFPLCSELRSQHPNGGHGETECPVCGNTLRYSVAGCNGHVWGQCETDDCLRWMQ